MVRKFLKPVLSLMTVALVGFGLWSCSNENDDSTENRNKQRQNEYYSLSKTIAEKQDFISLIRNLENFSELPKDFETIRLLGEKNNLTEEERLLLCQSLGFRDLEEAYSFDMDNYRSMSAIHNEFGLDRFGSEELGIIFDGAIEIATSPLGNSCGDRYKSCKRGAYGVYLVEHAGCAGAGIGVGVLSFWCAGCAGAGLWAVCVTGASMHLSSMLDDCRYDYNDCLQN